MLPIKNNHKNKKYRKKGNLRYSAKKYSNPFFQQKKRRTIKIEPHFSWRFKLVAAIILAIAIAGAWFLLYSKFFAITEINVNGSGNLEPDKVKTQVEEQINNNLFILWPQKNILLFNLETLRANLEKKYSFDILEIKKEYPRTININYQEKKHSIIWQEREKYFYADRNGDIINETTPLEIQQKDYPLISNQSSQKISNNKIPFNGQYLAYAINLFEKIKNYSEDFNLDRFIIDDEVNTIKIALIDGPQLFFNINESIDKQLDKVLIIKKEKLKDSFYTKTYIDVRIGDSVYFR